MGYKHHCFKCKKFLYEEGGSLIIPKESGIRLCDDCQEITHYHVFRHPEQTRFTCITTIYIPFETIFSGTLEECIQKMEDENTKSTHPFSGFNAGRGEY